MSQNQAELNHSGVVPQEIADGSERQRAPLFICWRSAKWSRNRGAQGRREKGDKKSNLVFKEDFSTSPAIVDLGLEREARLAKKGQQKEQIGVQRTF